MRRTTVRRSFTRACRGPSTPRVPGRFRPSRFSRYADTPAGLAEVAPRERRPRTARTARRRDGDQATYPIAAPPRPALSECPGDADRLDPGGRGWWRDADQAGHHPGLARGVVGPWGVAV